MYGTPLKKFSLKMAIITAPPPALKLALFPGHFSNIRDGVEVALLHKEHLGTSGNI